MSQTHGVYPEAPPKRTPLYDEHCAAGGKMIVFNHWELPVQYRGIIEEHHHTRTKVSLFDCSHMGRFLVTGKDAIRAMEPMTFNNMQGLPPGRCRYSSLLDVCGGIVDDIIAMRLSDDEMLVVTNAGPYARVGRILHRVCGACDLSPETAKIDVQGPLARDVVRGLGFEAAADLKYYGVCRAEWCDGPILIARAGYTGELGYEFYIPNALAAPLWQALLRNENVAPAGLGARDTLRLEMGYTLYGQDVDESHTTLEAGMGRFIDWDGVFQAKDYLLMQRDMGRYKIRAGIRSRDRRAPRPGYEVFHEGRPVGVVTSGCYGPSVGYGIGMAYLPFELSEPGIQLTAGPKEMVIETAAIPFYKQGTCRG